MLSARAKMEAVVMTSMSSVVRVAEREVLGVPDAFDVEVRWENSTSAISLSRAR
jgi:hypothetical protein